MAREGGLGHLNAARDGDLPRLRTMLKADPTLVQAEYWYTPPPHFATHEGHLQAVCPLASQWKAEHWFWQDQRQQIADARHPTSRCSRTSHDTQRNRLPPVKGSSNNRRATPCGLLRTHRRREKHCSKRLAPHFAPSPNLSPAQSLPRSSHCRKTPRSPSTKRRRDGSAHAALSMSMCCTMSSANSIPPNRGATPVARMASKS